MKLKITMALALCSLLFVAACKDDDPAADNILRLDGENATGPLLAAGEHELAIYFPESKMASYAGKELTEVEFFVGEPLPQTCLVRVYEGGSVAPANKLYEFDVTSGLQTLRWNRHILSDAVSLSGNDLWIAVFVVHSQNQQSIGCDAGPRQDGGDWLFQSFDGAWKTYQERTNESVNWNIRGKVK